MAIRGFRHKGLEELFAYGRTAKLGKRFHRTVLLILDHLDAIAELKDCFGVRGFHGLKGRRRGVNSMHVTANHRITFRWEDGDVLDVDFEDYH